MKLTAKGRYAVTSIAALAARGPGARVSLRELGEEQGIPLAFLEQVFAKLRRAGLVQSTRGASGGYALAVPAESLSVQAVIEAVDIDIRAQGCTPDMKTACTGAGGKCLTHDLWHALEDHIGRFLVGVTIADVLDSSFPLMGKVGERSEVGRGDSTRMACGRYRREVTPSAPAGHLPHQGPHQEEGSETVA